METIKIKVLAHEGTDEWMMKEYGSWEDHDKSPNHVCAILNREMNKKYMVLTRQEAETLLKSVSYHCSAMWDGNERIKYWMKTWTAYRNAIQKALSVS